MICLQKKPCAVQCDLCQKVQAKFENAAPTPKKKVQAKPRAKKYKPPHTPTFPGRPGVFMGVDPALRENGFWVAVLDRNENTITFHPIKHLGKFVKLLNDVRPCAVYVENSNLEKRIYKVKDKHGNLKDGNQIAVGKNMGVSQSAADIADEYSAFPSGISPTQKGAKITNEPIFLGILKANGIQPVGYKAGTGAAQDQRDAAKLAIICEQQFTLKIRGNAHVREFLDL